MLRAAHDGYADRFDIIHERTVVLSNDGNKLEGEDMFIGASGVQIRGKADAYAIRFHLHPSVKATRLTDGHGVMLMTAGKDVWTFSVPEQRLELEDSVFLGSSEGPRRTTQIVIHGNARTTPRVLWTFQLTGASSMAAATRQRARADEPRLPL
jgi:uncharacterized heparinase superfamily protein